MTNPSVGNDDVDADDARADLRDVAAELRDEEAVARHRRFPPGSAGSSRPFIDRWFAGRDADDAAGDRVHARDDRARARRDRERVATEATTDSGEAAPQQDVADQMVALRAALDARIIIGPAVGILMERFTVDADQAFEILKTVSNERNVKAQVVAADIVASIGKPQAWQAAHIMPKPRPPRVRATP